MTILELKKLMIDDLKIFRTFIKSVRKFKFYFEKNK